jgi:hypothetical protein
MIRRSPLRRPPLSLWTLTLTGIFSELCGIGHHVRGTHGWQR